MALAHLLIPALASYIFFIPKMLRQGLSALRSPLPHAIAAVNVAFCALMSILLFMDFASPLSFAPIKMAALLLCAFGFMAALTLSRILKTKNSLTVLVALSLLCAAFLETTIFNYKFWQTHDYVSTDLTEQIALTAGLAESDKGDKVYTTTGTGYISLQDLKMDIHNLCLDAYATDESGETVYLYATVAFTDKSNSSLVSTPKQTGRRGFPFEQDRQVAACQGTAYRRAGSRLIADTVGGEPRDPFGLQRRG